jgi:hypothetical protein
MSPRRPLEEIFFSFLNDVFHPTREKDLPPHLLHLTLIGPGEVKVDLADFDLKLQENLLSNLIFLKIPIPAETSSESF